MQEDVGKFVKCFLNVIPAQAGIQFLLGLKLDASAAADGNDKV